MQPCDNDILHDWFSSMETCTASSCIVVQVTVVESHSEPGGAAHTWQRGGYHFESGPSLYSGMNGG
jgi:hypothetical protein